MKIARMPRHRPGRIVTASTVVALIGVAFFGASAGAHAAAVDLNGKQCSDGAGYELDFSGSGAGGNISGSQINQQFVGHWRLRANGIVVTWQMVDEGGLSGRLVCSQKGNRLTCKDSGTTVVFTCRKGAEKF